MMGNQQQVSMTHAENGRSTISFPKTAQVKEDHIMLFSFNWISDEMAGKNRCL